MSDPLDRDHLFGAWTDGDQREVGEILYVAGRWLCVMSDTFVDPTHVMPLPSHPLAGRAVSPQLEKGNWEFEARKTQDHLSAVLQFLDVPHRVDWREWIDQLVEKFSPAIVSPQPEPPRDWLIFDAKDRLWWKPLAKGYTPNIDEAGRFTEYQAKGYESFTNDRHDIAVPAPPQETTRT